MFIQDKEIVAMTVAGIGLVLFLVTIFILSIVRYRKRVEKETAEKLSMTKQFERALLQSKLETQEETFRQIANELHDNVGQLLSTTKMLMGVTEKNLGHVPDTLHTASETLSRAILEIRLLSRSLDKEWLEGFNFLENLQSEIDRINSGKVISASIHQLASCIINSEKQLILFRIVQEAIQNAIRHGSPTKLEVFIIHRDDEMEVRVTNNGLPLPDEFHGMGTNNMRHRVSLLGGQVSWQHIHEETAVTICVPVKSEL